ncbi:MAG: hypothetical protein DMG10_26845 [Acidobacteria bacterium]|nr:MAG: hypothetical protein DMG10_26845 [Acidobacteriota bacterium]
MRSTPSTIQCSSHQVEAGGCASFVKLNRKSYIPKTPVGREQRNTQSFPQSIWTIVCGCRVSSTDRSDPFISGLHQLPPDFDLIDPGLAAVCVGAADSPRCGFIDRSGKYAINPRFESVQEFKNGLAIVFESKDSTASYIDRTGHVVWKGTKRVSTNSHDKPKAGR